MASQANARTTDVDIADISALADNTSSELTWEVAASWIARCDKEHQCSNANAELWYPTRLLDVRTSPGNVRLVITDRESMTGSYVTLSHRWGSHRPMILCESTASTLTNGVSIQELPPAFRDAIAVCSRLSSYIWIDSLCIQQDSREDWIREASLMHKVYSNSYLNISALAASDSGQTFYRERTRKLLDAPQIRTRLDGEGNLGNDEKTYNVLDQSFWVQEVDCAQLNRRAWVVQERLLSPRVLHFGRSQIYWECKQLQAAEIYPRGIPKERLPMQVDYKNGNWMHQEKGSSSPAASALYMWYNIVETYSMCNMTKAEDKLIALSGIAKSIAEQINDEYVAGMWRRTLVQDLCWRTQHRNIEGRATRSAVYRAPSFSWASMDSYMIISSYEGLNSCIEILDVHLDLATEDPMGMVSGGYLLIKCRLQTLRFGRNTADEPYMIVNDDDTYSVPGWTIYSEQKPTLSLDETPDTFDPIGRSGFFCCPILSGLAPMNLGTPMGPKDVVTWVIHLLLEPVDVERGIFRRIGLSRVRIRDPQPDPDEVRFWTSVAPEAHTLPAISYDGHHHTIRII